MSVGRTWSEAGFPKEIQSSSSSPSSSSIAWDHVSSPQLAAVRTLYSWTYYLINSEKTERFVFSVLKQMQSVSAGRCTFFSLSLCRFTQPVERLLWGADCTVMFVGHKSLTRVPDPGAPPAPPPGSVGSLSAVFPADSLSTFTILCVFFLCVNYSFSPTLLVKQSCHRGN